MGYLEGERVVLLAEQLDVDRSSVNRWLKWFDTLGAEGLVPRPKPGAAPRLTTEDLTELSTIIEAGPQAAVDTYGLRKTAHLFGAIRMDNADFTYCFADVFNGITFWSFLEQLVRKYVFLIIDNGPCHSLSDAGKQWLRANQHRIELHRLPPYSPELNPM
jgi:hypothetical protein